MREEPVHAIIGGTVAAAVRRAEKGLGASERRVVHFILSNPEAVLRMSAGELAREVRTAKSTVSRACQTLGFAGFQDLRLALSSDLALEASKRRQLDLTEDSSATDVLASVVELSTATLESIRSSVTAAQLDAAVDAVRSAHRLLVIGAGTSSMTAQDMAYRLSLLGLNIIAPVDAIAQHSLATQMEPGDVCVAISHTGMTRQTIDSALTAQQQGARVVAITSFSTAQLAQIANVSLVAGGIERGFRLESMSSRLAHLALIDTLFVYIALRTAEKSSAAIEMSSAIAAHHARQGKSI